MLLNFTWSSDITTVLSFRTLCKLLGRELYFIFRYLSYHTLDGSVYLVYIILSTLIWSDEISKRFNRTVCNEIEHNLPIRIQVFIKTYRINQLHFVWTKPMYQQKFGPDLCTFIHFLSILVVNEVNVPTSWSIFCWLDLIWLTLYIVIHKVRIWIFDKKQTNIDAFKASSPPSLPLTWKHFLHFKTAVSETERTWSNRRLVYFR